MPRHDSTEITFATIAFPSDRLSLKYLRTRFPDRNSLGDPGLFEREGDGLDEMVYLERGMANVAFERVAGTGDSAARELAVSFEQGGVEEAAQALADHYIRFGLAPGLTAARELVRKVERAGANQAAKILGRRP